MSSTRSSRGNPSIGDIIRSMVVIGAIILALFGIGKLFTAEPESSVKPIDYVSVVASARPAATFPLLAPKTLPEGWRATSARFQENGWHLGVLTSSEDYVGLEQVRGTSQRAVDRFADDSKSAGTAEVAGVTWNVRTGPDGRLTYLRNADGFVTLLNTTASRAVLERYISSLV